MNQYWRLLKFCREHQTLWQFFILNVSDQKMSLLTFYVKAYLNMNRNHRRGYKCLHFCSDMSFCIEVHIFHMGIVLGTIGKKNKMLFVVLDELTNGPIHVKMIHVYFVCAYIHKVGIVSHGRFFSRLSQKSTNVFWPAVCFWGFVI